MALEKRYDPKIQEPLIQRFWEDNNIFSFDNSNKKVFTIDTPPPTLSGRMHVGHAFSYSQGDFIARYKRMRGYSVLYPWGTDDNGLPTAILVEKQKKVTAFKMEHDEFVNLVLDYIKENHASFTADWKRLGVSADFKSAYSTIDPHCQRTSQLSFIELYEKGLVYRKKTPVSWCVKCQTAIAQAEFDHLEKDSLLSDIIFFGPDNKQLVISTTRPELIGACVALAAHPDDNRYTGLFGKKARVPLFDHQVPIIPDDSVDKEFGTGLMMVCTFGDKEDVEKWYRHKLPTRELFTPDGRLTSLAGKYANLKILEARKAILDDLRSKGFLLSQKQIRHVTNVHERCQTPIEFLHTNQWFIKVLDFKEELLSLAKQINWYPDFMFTRFKHWVDNLSWDWCISRQRHYGVPFPLWYDKQGNVVLADKKSLPVDPRLERPSDDLIPETDVLDTWATSSVTPQIVLGWADDPSMKGLFPMSVRLQAHDIIRTWAFYTIVKSLHHHGKPPWRDIVISGHALDPKGKKMSKSKGNVVDPNKVIEDYSADALRYWAASTKLGEDLPFMQKDINTGQKTINKLWNASRFATMHLESYDLSKPNNLELLDKWILSEFHLVVKTATEYFDKYEYSKTKFEVDNFFWNVFCDYYLEFIKGRLYNYEDGSEKKLSAQYALYNVLLGQLKLFAPIMPFVTEKIYSSFFRDKEGVLSIHVSSWPDHNDLFYSEDSIIKGRLFKDLIYKVRKYKSDNQLSLGASIPKAIIYVPSEINFSDCVEDFKSTARITDLSVQEGELDFVVDDAS